MQFDGTAALWTTACAVLWTPELRSPLWNSSSFHGNSYVGERVTVWDGEVRGILAALKSSSLEKKVLIL